MQIIHNFLYDICGAARAAISMENYLARRRFEAWCVAQVGITSACCWAFPAAWIRASARRCSAGGDSAGQLVCVYVDHGLMRKGETGGDPRGVRRSAIIDFVYVDASGTLPHRR